MANKFDPKPDDYLPVLCSAWSLSAACRLLIKKGLITRQELIAEHQAMLDQHDEEKAQGIAFDIPTETEGEGRQELERLKQ